MTAEAAQKALRAGAYAIVVSNHGGRVMDYGLSTAEVLPEIRAAVGAEGVQLYTEKLKAELKDAMTMTSCKSLQEITRDKIRLV